MLFASRSLEPAQIAPYLPLMEAGLIRRFYLDEMPELADAPLGLAILYLIRRADAEASAMARNLVARARSEIGDAGLRADLIELIETVIIYKLPRLSREEIQTMLQVHDIRETRVYQEAKEEGIKEGIEKGIEKGIKEGIKVGIKEGIALAIAKLAGRAMPPVEIAAVLEVDIELVQQVLKGRANG